MSLNQNKPLKQHVSLTLDEEIVTKIKLMAEESDRSFSQYINLVLKKYVGQKEKSKPEE